MAPADDRPGTTDAPDRPDTPQVAGRSRVSAAPRARASAVRWSVVVASLAVLTLAAACGSSDKTSSPDSGGTAPSESTDGTDLPPDAFQPVSVTFVSPDQGFVLGTIACTSPPCTSMRATDDGGATWRELPAPAAPLALSPDDTSPADGSTTTDPPTTDPSATGRSTDDTATTGMAATAISAVRFGDHLNGWAFGPGLWSTHDGGQHWSSQDLPGTVTDLASADGVTYAVVTNCPSGSCEQGATLYRTDATDDDWQVVDGASLPAEGGQIEVHARSAWFVGPSTADGGGATFLASTDGETWTQYDDPCLDDDALLDGVAPVDTSRVFLLCVNDPGAGSQGKSVRVSTDSGATSSVAGSPDRGGIASEIAAADADTVTISAQSGASFIYRSSDGGRSWTTSQNRSDGGSGYHDLGFTTATQGVVIYGEPDAAAAPPSTSRLLMTHDAGATWAPISIP